MRTRQGSVGPWPPRTRTMWTWSSSAPALPVSRQRARSTAQGASVVVLEARDRVGGRTLNHDIGDGKVVEVGGQWIGPTQDRLAALARELGRRDLPDLRRGRQPARVRRQRAPLHGARSRASTRRCSWTSSRRRRASTGWRGGCRSTRPGRRRARRSSTARPWPPGCAATWRTKSGRMLLELGVEAVWAAQPEDVSLLHVLFYIHSAGSARAAVRHRGRRPAGPVRGRLAADRAPDGRGAGRERSCLGAPVRRIEHGAGRRDRARGRRDRPRPARDRRDRAHARRPDRLRPAAARLPRPAHPADAARHGRQVHGDLRGAVLARGGADRAGHERRRARCGSRSTTRRPTARPACCSASSRAARRASSGGCARRSGAPR